MTKAMRVLVDIIVVVAASGLAYVLEGLANTRGWISVGAEARGVSAVVCGALAAAGVVRARGQTMADLGFRRPERWAMVPLQVAGILIVSSFVSMPKPDLSRYAALSGNLGAAITLALVLPLTASIPEEVIYRGFLIGRLSDLFGRSMSGTGLSVLIQALLFGSVHFMWGIGGMVVAFLMGLVWGTAYLLCGRNLWVVIIAHSAGHILGVVQLYLGKPIIV